MSPSRRTSVTVASSVCVSWANSRWSFPYSSESFASDCRACVRPLWTVHIFTTTPCSEWRVSLSFFVLMVGVPASVSFANFLTKDALMVGKMQSHTCLLNDASWNRASNRFLMLVM